MQIREIIGRNKQRANSRKRGSAVVEMALIGPLLILLVMMLIQYSIIMNTIAALTNLTREGAREGAVTPTDGDIRDRMEESCPSTICPSGTSAKADFIEDSVTIATVGNAPRTTGNIIVVTFTYDLRKKLFLPTKFFGMELFKTKYVVSTSMMIEPG